MITIPKWTTKHDKALEEYFKEDEEGNSKQREDYYSDDLPLMDVNNYIVNLYHCPPEERWERVQELIPVKWYCKILEVIGLELVDRVCSNCKHWDYPTKESMGEQCKDGWVNHLYRADSFGCSRFESKD